MIPDNGETVVCKIAVSLIQIVALLTLTTGKGFTFTETVAELEQPEELVPVTE